MTSTPTFDDLRKLIEVALAPGGDAVVTKDGRSRYDLACEAIGSVDQAGPPDVVPALLMTFLEEGAAKPVEWWLHFLNMFEEVVVLTQRSRLSIRTKMLASIPEDSQAQAYILRFLAYRDCAIPWDDLPSGIDLDGLNKKWPLVLADAYVWSDRYEEGLHLLKEALETHTLAPESLKRMVERWSNRVGPAGESFVQKIEALVAEPARPQRAAPIIRSARRSPAAAPSSESQWIETIARFGQTVKASPLRFPQTISQERTLAHA